MEKLRGHKDLTLYEQVRLPLLLSLPSIFAQISSIMMSYIDASMVGSLGANDSASIGLVSTSTWLFGNVCSAICVGFTVQVANLIGASREKDARNVMKQGFFVSMLFSLLLTVIAAAISRPLPGWLGGNPDIRQNAFLYFLVFALSLPVRQLDNLTSGMLQCSGNMRIPGAGHIAMCFLDILFNALLIYPSGTHTVFGLTFRFPGAGLGVVGAALGTTLAELCVSLYMLWFLLRRSPSMRLKAGEKLRLIPEQIRRAVRIALPIGFEGFVTCAAQVTSTIIVAPLGTAAIAANSFAITAEALCYKPGYGIGSAATTLIGQSIGAGRKDYAKRLSNVCTLLGVGIMTTLGIAMYIFAPQMIGLLTPVDEIRDLGAAVLRIEAFAEPLYAASIVASGALRGAGDTLIPSCLNFLSMWAVRIPVAAILAPMIGLKGVWIAMAVELSVRGILFLYRLLRGKWLNKID